MSFYELKNTIGYDTPGSLGQYGFYDCNIPVICIEEQEGIDQNSIDDDFFENKRSFGIILSSKYVRSNAIQLPRALARG